MNNEEIHYLGTAEGRETCEICKTEYDCPKHPWCQFCFDATGDAYFCILDSNFEDDF